MFGLYREANHPKPWKNTQTNLCVTWLTATHATGKPILKLELRVYGTEPKSTRRGPPSPFRTDSLQATALEASLPALLREN